MLRVGITGGIGSGKTTVCRIFSELNIPVYNADQKARFLLENNPDLKEKIVQIFGTSAYMNGKYNISYISSIVFGDKSKLKLLNAASHPFVRADWETFCAAHKDAPYIVKEAAILLESGGRDTVDKLIVVHAPEHLRIKWIVERDGTDREVVISKMKNQMSEEEKLSYADAVIVNDGKQSLIRQVVKLHKDICALNF